jgi:long-subunit acyl-CoA synthetase (AMP-forming)
MSLDQIICLGQEKPLEAPTDNMEATGTVIYTSGSTGKPKGALFTRKLWKKLACSHHYKEDPLVSICKGKTQLLSFQRPQNIVDSLAHISERESKMGIFFSGGRIGMLSSQDNIFNDIQTLGPCSISSTPRFFNVIYSQFQTALSLECSLAGENITQSQNSLIRKEASSLRCVLLILNLFLV